MISFAVFIFFVATVLLIIGQFAAGVILLYCCGQTIWCIRRRSRMMSSSYISSGDMRDNVNFPPTAVMTTDPSTISSTSSSTTTDTINPLSQQTPPGYARTFSSSHDLQQTNKRVQQLQGHRLNFEIHQATIIMQQQQQLRQQLQTYDSLANQQQQQQQQRTNQQHRTPHPAVILRGDEEEKVENAQEDPKSPEG
jgi:hypothetical protein